MNPTKEMTTLDALARGAGIYATIREDWNDKAPKWADDKRHFKIQLRHDRRSMSLWFYQGTMASDPKVSTILECLASDANMEYDSLDDFISEMGATITSVADFREQECIYKQLNKQNKSFARLIGNPDLMARIQEVM